MSQINVDIIRSRTGTAATCDKGLVVSGVTTASGGVVGDVTGTLTGTATGLSGSPNITVTDVTANTVIHKDRPEPPNHAPQHFNIDDPEADLVSESDHDAGMPLPPDEEGNFSEPDHFAEAPALPPDPIVAGVHL